MKFKKYILLFQLTFAYLISGSLTSLAQAEPTAQILIANSTNATLTIEVFRKTERGHIRGKVSIKIPPTTERTITVPAGYVTLVGNAYRSAPAKRFEEQFAISTNAFLNYNITPQKFGTTHLADRLGRVNSEITFNLSKLMITGANACAEGNWKTGLQWSLSGPGGNSPYYETGGFLCRKSTEGFYVMGDELTFFDCYQNFQKCSRKANYDAILGKIRLTKNGKITRTFTYKNGTKSRNKLTQK